MIDTLDGLLMSWAYGFAAEQDADEHASSVGRRLYNVYLTAASSAIAIVVGIIEVLGCVQKANDLDGPFWDVVEGINDNFESAQQASPPTASASTHG